MDAFVSRKKRKLSSPDSATTIQDDSALNALEDESTDFKLALLSSMHPYIEQQVLLDVLLAHQGSVEAALTSLKSSDSPPRKASAATKRAKLLSKKGKTLHLYDPADVAAHTPCSIIHNFLPAEEANTLLEELLKEAPSFERMTFKLFDNVVQSPHTACFYVQSHEEVRSQKTEYLYNGALLTVGVFGSFPPIDMIVGALSHIIYLSGFVALTFPGCPTTHSPHAKSFSHS
jgi:hypothetical protein